MYRHEANKSILGSNHETRLSKKDPENELEVFFRHHFTTALAFQDGLVLEGFGRFCPKFSSPNPYVLLATAGDRVLEECFIRIASGD